MSDERALAGWRVVDLTAHFGYASRLYADLGADVTLVEPPQGSAARLRPPLHDGASLWFEYRNGGKSQRRLDLDAAQGRAALAALLAAADVVFDDRPQAFWRERGLDWPVVHARRPQLVWCSITPCGQTGPASEFAGSDLTAMAAGGMAWLTGYEDSGPLVADCGLATTSAAQYAAVLSLIAALGRERVGSGQFIDVSMQEVVALGTETAPQFIDMKGVLRRRLGGRARQAGIGVYPCADGEVFLYASESGVGRGWNLLVQWLVEAGAAGAAALADPAWLDNAFKAQAAQREAFEQVWRAFAARRTRRELFAEGQRRRIAITPVNEGRDVLADAHLRERGFFGAGGMPGAPYGLSATPWQRASAPPPASAPARALPAGPGGAQLPLAGLRVIDLTWVGAGPLTTKLLADFGAEVWKIESPQRPDQLRRAEPLATTRGLDASGYFANRNTHKKSVRLDLKNPRDVQRIRALLEHADVLANSFTPGVMERVGLGWDEVSKLNPRLVTLSMPFAGEDGPYRDFLGYGMNIAALVGQFARHRVEGRMPVGTGTNFPDHLPNPLHACFALLAALAWRERSGRGQRIVVSQIESTLAACPDAVMDAAAHGAEAPPGAYFAHHAGPTGIYRCAGVDRWVAVDVVDAAQQVRLAEVLGGAPPSSLAAWLAQRSPEDAVARLRAAGLAAAAVADPADLLRDAQLSARGFWQRVAHPVIGDALYHGIAARLSHTPTAYRAGAPLLGQHDAELPALLDSCGG